MRDESERPNGESSLFGQVRLVLPEAMPPPDLLGRCLATISDSGTTVSARNGRPVLKLVAAAAILLAGVSGWLARPVEADAAELLEAARSAWAEVPTAHRVARETTAGVTRTEETWYVRGKGRRTEVRSENERLSLAVDNGRWKFRIDERTNLAVAWSSTLSVSPDREDAAGLVIESEAFLRWAEVHRGEIRVGRETLAGAEARKVVVRWPGPDSGTATPRVTTFWFDPDANRPLRQRVEYGDGRVVDVSIDYPSPAAVPGDLFAFRPSRGVSVEINDPDLGRQIYSPGLSKGEGR